MQEKVQTKQAEANEVARAQGEEPVAIDENKIRKEELEELHRHMDLQLEKRKYRLMEAEIRKDTTMQWDLIAAATEEANIQYHNLQGREATKMKGRSKLNFKKKTRDSLEGIEADDGNLEQVSKAKWLRQVAAAHTKMGNKLTNVARRMKTKHKGQGGELTKDENKDLIQRTFKAYCQMASKQSAKHLLNDQQKNR